MLFIFYHTYHTSLYLLERQAKIFFEIYDGNFRKLNSTSSIITPLPQTVQTNFFSQTNKKLERNINEMSFLVESNKM